MKSRVEARRTSPVRLTVVVEQLGVARLTVLGLEKREKVVVRNVNILVLVKRPSTRTRGVPPHAEEPPHTNRLSQPDVKDGRRYVGK